MPATPGRSISSSWLPPPLRALWGDLTPFELRKYLMLMVMFFAIVGSYWLMRPLKDGVFKATVGVKHMPLARMLSFAVIVPLILLYAKLVDIVPRHVLIYVVCAAYGITFLIITGVLLTPYGLTDEDPSPKHIIGWVTFFAIESYGSIAVSLFWSFVAITTDQVSAKKGYPLIVFGGQVGAIIGPAMAISAVSVPLPALLFSATCVIFSVIGLTKIYMIFVEAPAQVERELAEEKPQSTKTTPGFLVGLKLLITQPYLMGIFGVSTIYEVVGTVMDFQMKMVADAGMDKEHYTAFLGIFGVSVNTLSMAISLLGTSAVLRKYGVSACLLIYPSAVAVGLVCIMLYPDMWVVFAAQVVLKGVSYALNNPAKEILYLPTNPDVKYKVKSWIDMFGGRAAKALGGALCEMWNSHYSLMIGGSMVSLGWVAVWVCDAVYVSRVFKELTGEEAPGGRSVEEPTSVVEMDMMSDKERFVIEDEDDM